MKEKLTFRTMDGSLLKCISDYQKHKSRQGWRSRQLRRFARLRHLFWSVITASEVDLNATIGERFRLPHPNGVIVHPGAVIGDDCMFMGQVTIGQLSEGDAPVIGSGVFIGVGAKVLGKVVIGDRARIGANAVVLVDVPAGWTAVGVPARLIPPKDSRAH